MLIFMTGLCLHCHFNSLYFISIKTSLSAALFSSSFVLYVEVDYWDKQTLIFFSFYTYEMESSNFFDQ